MSATPADDVQTSPAWNCGCKGSDFIWFVQMFFVFLSEIPDFCVWQDR